MKRKTKQQLDFQAVREIGLCIDNEYSIYQKECALGKNYTRKWNKGKFNFQLAQKGVKNLIVTPYARKYQKEFGVRTTQAERDAIAKGKLRRMFPLITGRDGSY